MKRLFLSILWIVGSGYSVVGQESTFHGYFSPTESHLVPLSIDKNVPENTVIKPNFKGKELLEEVNLNIQHNPDWLWQQHENMEKVATATLLWQVQGTGTGISPPDPTGDADNQYYIQATNGAGGGTYKIYNKSTGALVAGGTGGLTMQSLGGPSGLGDPIILYHKTAQKWFLTEFSSSGNKLLVHVSQTSNPQGAYWTYQFTCPSFPDYPKWAISETSDALTVTTNEGGPPTVYAMRLSSLITGATSPFIGVDIGYSLNGFGFQSITPVDLEGDNAAPAGMKPLFVRHRDDESHSAGSPDSGTNDWIEFWEMTINWTNNTATVAKVQDLAIAEIDSDLCGLVSFSCIQQPAASQNQDLDPLRETVMYKAPMRVFQSHQVLLVCLATDVSGTNRAGVRWCEIRRPSGSLGSWSLYQEGTYSPGTTNRWMPAINMDKDGNIMMAYSTSSGTAGDFPSLKFTGRKPCDPLGQMTVTETTIIAGASSRTSNTRWGDYHHMSVDPFTDDVFYFTGVYMAASNSIRTNLSAFKMNPDAVDAGIVNVFQVSPGSVCGSSTQVGVVIQNKGTNALTSGTLQWQIGTGATTNVNWTSAQLGAINGLDTVYVTITGLVNGSNTVNFDNITANTLTPDDNDCNNNYSLTITSGAGSTLIVSATLTQQPSCVPGGDGQISISVTGGTAPYSYSVNGGSAQPANIFNGLSQGTSNYVVTDNVGCSGSGSINVANSTVITVTPSITATLACNGDTDAAVQITATGGTGSYTYSNDGATFAATNSFNSLGAGTYTFYAKDAGGCQGSNSITITQPSMLTLNAIPTAITCFGANDGLIQAVASNGTSGYTYSIDGTSFSSASTFTGLSAGTYTIYTQDNNGCNATFNTTVIEPTLLSVIGIGTFSNGTDGTITLTGDGGTTPYTYSLDGSIYQSASLFTGLSGGTYTCYIKDNNGCISTVIVKIEQLGIDDNASSTGNLTIVNLYPNPTSGVITLEVSGIEGERLDVRFFNMAGQLIAQANFSSNNGTVNQTIELSKKIAAGQYYIGIYDGLNTPVITKIVKQ